MQNEPPGFWSWSVEERAAYNAEVAAIGAQGAALSKARAERSGPACRGCGDTGSLDVDLRCPYCAATHVVTVGTEADVARFARTGSVAL